MKATYSIFTTSFLLILSMIDLHAQGSLTLIGPRHYVSNLCITPSISSIQTVAIDTIVVAANQIQNLKMNLYQKSQQLQLLPHTSLAIVYRL